MNKKALYTIAFAAVSEGNNVVNVASNYWSASEITSLYDFIFPYYVSLKSLKKIEDKENYYPVIRGNKLVAYSR